MDVENGAERVKVDDKISIRYRESVRAVGREKCQYGLQPGCVVGLTLVSRD